MITAIAALAGVYLGAYAGMVIAVSLGGTELAGLGPFLVGIVVGGAIGGAAIGWSARRLWRADRRVLAALLVAIGVAIPSAWARECRFTVGTWVCPPSDLAR